MSKAARTLGCASLLVFLFSACSGEDGADTSNTAGPATADASTAPTLPGAGGTQAGPAAPQSPGVSVPAPSAPGATPGGVAGMTGAPPVGAGALPGGATQGGAAAGAAATGGGTAGAAPAGGPSPTPTFVDGPVNGDPSKPVVSIPDVACGGSKGGLDGLVGGAFGGFPVPGTANIKIGGRDVILTYPCNKREGAVVTFILNLHGTMPDDSLKYYQHSYFAAHKLADSHNLIIATPKSVVSQWGNGDNGVDRPHLFEVIDWVYTKFAKFQIAGLWVAGHSWGSMFAKGFVCEEKLKERARGVIGQSGGATGVGAGGFGGGGAAGAGAAGCADRLSQIHTNGELEGGESGVPNQTAPATKHGCKAKVGPMDLGNKQLVSEWPDCSPGWTHFNVVMGAHEHTTPINPEVVKFIVEKIKATEKKP